MFIFPEAEGNDEAGYVATVTRDGATVYTTFPYPTAAEASHDALEWFFDNMVPTV